MADKIEFKAIIEREVINNDNFKMYGVNPTTNRENIKFNPKYNNATITGDIQELTIGIEYKIVGVENKYGYEVVKISRDKPTTLKQKETYLKEILTEKQAKTLLSVYPDIIDKIMNDDIADIDLSKTKGIKAKTFDTIKSKIIENFYLIDFINEFEEYHLTMAVAKKLHDSFPSIEQMKKRLFENPYDTLCAIKGISFKTADKIILSIQRHKDLISSEQRTEACIKLLLNENENNGNTWILFEDLYKQCYELIPESIDNIYNILKNTKYIYVDKDTRRISFVKTYQTELYIAQRLLQGLKCNKKLMIDYEKYYRVDGNNLTEEQQGVLKNFCQYNISLLIGNSGSGKSFCTQSVINLCRENNLSYTLMTPTGKSAIVLGNFTNTDAGTIHRKLGYNPQLGWCYNEDNKLDVDLVLVDENGMTDIFLMKHLLEAIDFNRTRLIFVQDDAQLPSVSCGNCAYDLINSKIIPYTRLTKIFRYGEGGLMTVATKIRLGEKFLNTKSNDIQIFGKKEDYSFIPTDDEYISDYVVGIYKKLLSQNNEMSDIMVLSSKNINENGTMQLNKVLQEKFNPHEENKRWTKHGDTIFRQNDVVMQIVNNYKAINEYEIETTITNGEIGTIQSITMTKIIVKYAKETIVYTKDELNQLKLAYSISIHKSQGSTVKNVIIVTPKSHSYNLNKNLMYVGITRASDKCFHIGSISAVQSALRKSAELQRNTWLLDLLNKDN